MRVICGENPAQLTRVAVQANSVYLTRYRADTLLIQRTRKTRDGFETLVLVSRRLEDMKNGLGLEEKVLVLVLTKKSRYFQDLDE